MRPAAEGAWGVDGARGRLVELMVEGDGAALTVAIDWILEAQEAGEPCAWVGATDSIFDPEDAALAGVDLAALAVVRARGALPAARAAELLLRSGAFGVVALDLGPGAHLPPAALGKLVQLARRHDAVVLALTAARRGGATLGSLVSLRIASRRTWDDTGRIRVSFEAIKDKRQGPGWQVERLFGGPPGVR
jgi:recombination protein RecA